MHSKRLQKKWKYYGNISRQDSKNLPKEAIFCKPWGQGRGRPQTTLEKNTAVWRKSGIKALTIHKQLDRQQAVEKDGESWPLFQASFLTLGE